MSFQHFRLGELGIGQSVPAHIIQHHIQPQPHSQFSSQNDPSQAPSTSTITTANAKRPYGSGDHEDGYTLVFPSLEAFHAWRQQEEESQMVEFVKGDTHGSKAVPPRFKDHTKLVCARHSRSGRKKYVKKHPERIRKVPSRKLEGQGCTASISYKTYFDSDVVRACYMSHHTHEIGPANLPFTRRGRKAAVQQEKEKSKRFRPSDGSSPSPSTTATSNTATSNPGPSTMTTYNSAVSMLAPLPPSQAPPFAPPQQFGHSQVLPQDDRWDRMSVLYNAVRNHARSGFDYPGPSVAALESVLIRLYLESPVAGVLMNGNPIANGTQPMGPQVMQPAPNANESGGVGDIPAIVTNANSS